MIVSFKRYPGCWTATLLHNIGVIIGLIFTLGIVGVITKARGQFLLQAGAMFMVGMALVLGCVHIAENIYDRHVKKQGTNNKKVDKIHVRGPS